MTKKKFGTTPVFFTAISTILGAIMFLRFGFAVGNIGFIGTLGIIAIGHIVTIATALSIAEIATNKKVEGGGEYFIISRSFGLKIGASIGIALYLSQAISVAFYIVAMMEAFNPLLDWFTDITGYYLLDKRFISIPVMGIIAWIMLKYGAKMGLKALYVVVAILFISIILFFLGNTNYVEGYPVSMLFEKVTNNMGFFTVFAIIFPAFTGMTAGVGLSGDLKNPSKSLPWGTLAATITGMIIYIFIALKLAYSASPEDLNADQLIMSKIALWGPIIPIGLAAATFSSALGSMMIAPRTLQAIASDNIIPSKTINTFLSKSGATTGEPVNAAVVTSIFATIFLLIGDVDFVAKIISMFFMVTYGSLCLISFLEHFSSDPSYRPTFRSRWYFSLAGAVMCIWLMFSMNFLYAVIAIGIMALLYIWINSANKEEKGLEAIFEGVIFQTSRKLQVFLQQKNSTEHTEMWRPSMVCVSSNSFNKLDTLDLSRWIAHKYGFCTYVHLIEGELSKETHDLAEKEMHKLLQLENAQNSNVYLDTIISPNYTSALRESVQFPSISGKSNNVVLFEYDHDDTSFISEIEANISLVKSINMDACVLRTSSRGFGYRKEINIWITSQDFRNGNLMILLGYIILGHSEWKNAQIKIFAVLQEENMQELKTKLYHLIRTGRLPISKNNINIVTNSGKVDLKALINEKSADADLTFVGFNDSDIKNNSIFTGYSNMGNIIFVSSINKKQIL